MIFDGKKCASFTLSVSIYLMLIPTMVGASEELLAQVRAGNRAALESIRTLACRVTRSSPATPSSGSLGGTSTADYWWDGTKSRVRPLNGPSFLDSILEESTQKVLIPAKNKEGREVVFLSIARLPPPQPHTEFDPWGESMLKLCCGPNSFPVSLEELLQQSHSLGELDREQDGDRTSIIVPISVPLNADVTGEFRIWFDPDLNYLAYKLVGTFPSPDQKSKIRRETVALDHQEVAPGLYFPRRAETRFYNEHTVIFQVDYTFANTRMNETMPADTFALKVPAGTEVLDMIESRRFTIDGNGEPVGPMQIIPPTTTMNVDFGTQGARPQSASTQEARSLTNWILPISLAVLGIAGGLWVLRNWRRGDFTS